ncbi:MAG TPA: hypothetical protein VHE35_30720 [Kofleriaceae bacterium]|nr:hypothetical protein [Kofleriaceae bacterium]
MTTKTTTTRTTTTRTTTKALALLLLLAGCADAGDPTDDPTLSTSEADLSLSRCALSARYELRDIGGANFNTLTVDPSILPLSKVGAVLADDQIHMLRMADSLGLRVRNKHVPAFLLTDAGGNPTSILAGGFYQCATREDCQGYLDEVIPHYALGGVPFLDRPEFHHSFAGHAYDDVGGAQFLDVDDGYAIRIQRWRVTFDPRLLLRLAWLGHARQDACERGLAQAHLLYSPTEHVVAEVTIGPKVTPPPGDPTPYFAATYGALASQPPLVPALDSLPGVTRLPPELTDTYLVLTYWPGAEEPGLWPNSPSTTAGGPLPEPFCGDGACNTTATRAESAATCPADCAPTCGDGACDGGETDATCAIDCPP